MFEVLKIFQASMGIACLIFIGLMIKQKESNISKLMLCVGFLGAIQNLGYFLELQAADRGQAMIAVKVQYMGGAFIATFLFFFILLYCNYEIPRWVQVISLTIDLLVLLIVWNYEAIDWYYTSVYFDKNCTIPHLILGKGWLYIAFTIKSFTLMIISAFVAFRTKQTTKGNAWNLITLGIISVLPIFGFIFNYFDLLHGYDSVPGCVGIAILIYAIIIIKYHVFDIISSAHENIIKTMDEIVLVLDAEGRYVESNDKAKELLYCASEFKKGEVIRDDCLEQIFNGKNNFDYVSCNRNFEVHVNKIWNNKMLAGYAVVFVDVTQSKEQIRQMQLLKTNAEKANRAKSEFLARMSHEIRTPINAVMGMNEMVLRETDNEDIKKYSLDIRSSARILLGIINDILDFSKIESGKMEIVPVRYELGRMLNDIYNMISLRAEEKGLKLIMHLNENLPSAYFGDDIRIRQILVNILTNAIKYTKKGTVTFSLDGNINGEIASLHFSVQDTGIGIKKEDMKRLFLEFERIDEEQNRNIEGTGLGMNITQKLLQLMGSELHCESVYGEGSTFSFVLEQKVEDFEPVGIIQKKVKKNKNETAYTASFTAPDANILLVDDNRVNRKVFCGLLKQTSVNITDVGSGLECLEKIKDTAFDIIFLDHMMPEMDGVETFRRMRLMEQNACRNAPVIMLTANALTGAKEQYLDMGFQDFLAKPIDHNMLEKLMIKWLPKEKVTMLKKNK